MTNLFLNWDLMMIWEWTERMHLVWEVVFVGPGMDADADTDVLGVVDRRLTSSHVLALVATAYRAL